MKLSELKGSVQWCLLPLLPDEIKRRVFVSRSTRSYSFTTYYGNTLYISEEAEDKNSEIAHELSHWIQNHKTNTKRTIRKLKVYLNRDIQSINTQKYIEDLVINYPIESRCTQDILYGVTKDKRIIYKHSDKYYDEHKDNLYYEVFANIGEAILMGGIPRIIVEYTFPECTNYVREIFRKRKIKEGKVFSRV